MSQNEMFHLENGACRILDGISRITKNFFEGCKDEMVKLYIPQSVKAIRGEAFEDCNKLVEFEVAEANTQFRVENGCLMGTDGTLVRAPAGNQVDFPAGVTKIGDYAFYRTRMRSVVLPPTVTEIGRCAFAYSWPLERVDPLPEGLTTIKDFAFQWCSLKEVTIPESVCFIGNGVFGWNNGLRLDLRCRRLGRCGWLVPYPDEDRKLIRIFLSRYISISGELTKNMRPAAVLGFAELYVKGEEMSEEYRTDSLRYILNKRKELYQLALESPDLLKLMEAEQIIPARDIDMLIQKAGQNRQPDLVKELEAYKDEVLGGSEQVAKELQKAEQLAKRQALGKMPEPERMQFLLTFLRRLQAGEAVPEEEQKACLSYIRRNRLRLACATPQHPELFHFILREEILSQAECGEVLETLQAAGDPALTAALLSYQQRRFGGGSLDAPLLQMDIMASGVISPKEAALSWQYEKTEAGGIRLLGYKGRKADVEVPQAVGKSPVTQIGDYAFSPKAKRLTQEQRAERSGLRSIHVPDGIVEIGGHAFDGCAALEEVSLPATLERMGPGRESERSDRESRYPFCLCPALRSLTIADGNQTYRVEDGLLLERTETGLELLARVEPVAGHVRIPDGIAAIPDKCFAGCQRITDLTLPGSVKSIGNDAFIGCAALARVELGEGVQEIGDRAFYNCPSLISIDLPATIDKYCHDGFDEHLQTWSISPQHPQLCVEGPLLLDKQRQTVFRCLRSAAGEVRVPDTVRNIFPSAFFGCKRLREVVIPEGVRTIGSLTFAFCKSLTDVTLPASVTAIEHSAFASCFKPTIHAPAGSYAEQYAKEHNIPFQTL